MSQRTLELCLRNNNYNDLQKFFRLTNVQDATTLLNAPLPYHCKQPLFPLSLSRSERVTRLLLENGARVDVIQQFIKSSGSKLRLFLTYLRLKRNKHVGSPQSTFNSLQSITKSVTNAFWYLVVFIYILTFSSSGSVCQCWTNPIFNKRTALTTICSKL